MIATANTAHLYRQVIGAGSVKTLALPPRSPNLNSKAERWVRSVKEECLSRLILVGESSLRRALQQYTVHYHEERNHQGKGNRILFPSQTEARRNTGAVRCRERLGGLLKYYEREAAVDGTAGDGLTMSTKDAGNLPRQKTSRT